MKTVVTQTSQSLLAFAKSQLPNHASDASIRQAVQSIAQVNGLTVDAQLRPNQTLVVPDVFAGVVGSDSTIANAVVGFSAQRTGSTMLGFLRSEQTRPLVELQAQFADTRPVPVETIELPPIAGKTVSGQISKFTGVSTPMHEAALRTVDAKLGTLTRAEFDAVHKELGGRSQIHFDPAREYHLTDFLPPALQALVNKDLELPQPVVLEGTESIAEEFRIETENVEIGHTANCHGTAWEAVRAYQGVSDNVAVFYGDMISLDRIFDDGSTFETIASLDAAEAPQLKQQDLKPGDWIVFRNTDAESASMSTLLHSAVYVGGGLFFEKPNTEGAENVRPDSMDRPDETPYRLTTMDDMIKPIDDVSAGHFSIDVLRAASELPDPSQVFVTWLTSSLQQWADNKGRKLGVELVPEYVQGGGGGISGEYPIALLRVGLRSKDDGTSELAQ